MPHTSKQQLEPRVVSRHLLDPINNGGPVVDERFPVFQIDHRAAEGERMPQYMVAVYQPDNYDPSVETDATIEAIHALNREFTWPTS